MLVVVPYDRRAEAILSERIVSFANYHHISLQASLHPELFVSATTLRSRFAGRNE